MTKKATTRKKAATKPKDKTQVSSKDEKLLSNEQTKKKREGAMEPAGMTIKVVQLTAREFAKRKDSWSRKYLFGSAYLERPEFQDADTNAEVYEAMLDT